MRRDKKQKKRRKSGKIVIFLVILLMIGLGVALGYSIQKNGGGLQGLLATILGQDSEKLEDLDTINILVLRSK